MVDFKALVPWRDKSQTPAPREDYADPFLSVRRDVDRIFDDFFNGFGRALGSPSGSWMTPTPSIDLTENEKEIVVTAEMPGLEEKDFEATVSGDVLTLKGEKKAEHERRNGDAYYVERHRFGSFSRSVRLPFEVKDEKVDARYEKGVLTIRVPKPADMQRRARRIDVRTV